MGVVPPFPVEAPAALGLRYGLFVAANGPLDLPPRARGGGVIYEPTSCGFARLYPIECDDTPPSKEFDPSDPLVTAEAFMAYATYVCGPAGQTPATIEAKVRQRLTNGEQTIAESALATTLAADAVTIVPGSPTNFQQVVGELEQWLYGIDTANYGPRGFLHAPPRYATLAAFAGTLVPDGPRYRTQLGTVWVFGGGYPDDGNLYITGNTTVWRATDVQVPDVSETFDRTHNQYNALAEREYAVSFDCVAAKATYTGDPAAS